MTIIKSAKKYEKKGKIEKANKRYEKALTLLIKSNEKKPNISRYTKLSGLYNKKTW